MNDEFTKTPHGNLIARQLRVRGQVQGVYYRETCRREALSHGLTGCAINRPDGSVEVYLEGPADGVKAVTSWCEHGPEHARVDDVEIIELGHIGISGFTIG